MAKIWVKSHTREDGTKVKGHWRQTVFLISKGMNTPDVRYYGVKTKDSAKIAELAKIFSGNKKK